jgi:hypothetical protein
MQDVLEVNLSINFDNQKVQIFFCFFRCAALRSSHNEMVLKMAAN